MITAQIQTCGRYRSPPPCRRGGTAVSGSEHLRRRGDQGVGSATVARVARRRAARTVPPTRTTRGPRARRSASSLYYTNAKSARAPAAGTTLLTVRLDVIEREGLERG